VGQAQEMANFIAAQILNVTNITNDKLNSLETRLSEGRQSAPAYNAP
jgi:hypothetical protein